MLCRAKVNLTLHVGALMTSGDWKGYHPVDSLVVFAEFGDQLGFEPASQTSLFLSGRFGNGLTVGADNLILQAMQHCNAPPHKIHLTKNLPISSGLGGGSANAAAILRRFDPDMRVKAVALGADVPVCRRSETALMQGVGERVTPLPGLGTVCAVLVNPGIAVSTAKIFKLYDSRHRAAEPQSTLSSGSLIDRAKTGHNDLEAVAMELEPCIADVLSDIGQQAGCRLARMSGSGATCFGLFDNALSASNAASALQNNYDWVVATRLGDVS